MSQSFTITATRHGAFGNLVTLTIPGQPGRRFTPKEAMFVSRALIGAARGTSRERQIYMSPIASDHEFDAQVGPDGIVLASNGYGAAMFDWDETQKPAQELERFGLVHEQ